MYAFIPKRIDIEGYPQLNNLPLNILICEVSVHVQSVYLYKPDSSSYKEEGDYQFLIYRGQQQGRVELNNPLQATDADIAYMVKEVKNPENREIRVQYLLTDQKWHAEARRGGEVVGIVMGSDWGKFFIQLGQLYHRGA